MSIQRTADNIYDINTYTDLELYDILDLNNPTDRELEAKILFLINRYANMQTAAANQLVDFFENIYTRFFKTDDDDNSINEDNAINADNAINDDDDETQIIEGFGEKDDSGNYITDVLSSVLGITNDKGNGNRYLQNKSSTEAIKKISEKSASNIDPTKTVVAPSNNLAKVSTESTQPNTATVGYTKSLDYAKDRLNPLLQQTIKRVISIDSQYREDKRTLSTEFTFNLSDPLKDVVSLKLYSIQIPYTWYTISNSFGSNVFYLKGNSPGINDGNHDHRIDISAGNYTPTELATSVNNSIQLMKDRTTDVSFGNTSISYNSNTSLTKLIIDISNQYNETGYYLHFPNTTPFNINQRFSTISSYLGFKSNDYKTYSINSSFTLPLDSSTNDINNRTYNVNSTNNKIVVYKYIGTNGYSIANVAQNVVDASFAITLSLQTGSNYTRTEIVTDLSNQIAKCPYINTAYSYIQRFTDTTNSYFQLSLKTNRTTTNNIAYSKLAVLFPTETTTTPIWLGINSCFNFQTALSEMNTIYSEISPVSEQTDRFIITNSPYILLHCKKSGFDVSYNDYKFTLTNSPSGYTLTDYVNAINNAISKTSIDNSNNGLNYEINTNYTKASINDNNTFNIQFDITKIIQQNKFTVNLTDSILHSIFNLPTVLDPSLNNTFNSVFLFSATYNIPAGLLASFRCKTPNLGIKSDVSYNVYLPALTQVDSTTLATTINDAFRNYQDTDGQNVLAGTNISFSLDNTTGLITSTLKIIVNKTLSQSDYNIQFFDTTSSSWLNYLHIDPLMINQAYSLSNTTNSNLITMSSSYTTVYGSSQILLNTITLTNQNNTIQIIPWESGVASAQNIMTLSIPYGTYTRKNLVTAINNSFSSYPDLSGSTVSFTTNTSGVELTNIHVTINKVYTAKDYRMVFYDPVSFVRCYVGITSVRNTTWDTTLGWILGFREYTSYDLSTYQKGEVIIKYGDTGVSTNLFNYFLLCLDDYNQNHLNDGLVTVTGGDTNVPLPSYAKKSNFVCDPVTGTMVYNTDELVDNKKLTQAQIYAIGQIANSQKSSSSNLTNSVSSKSYGSGPFVKDVFGLIPMKTAGLQNGSSYVEFGGTLQNQERSYFGPVNIHRMTVKLVNDRGDVVDLNGANWSFSLICEQLYKQKPSAPTA